MPSITLSRNTARLLLGAVLLIAPLILITHAFAADTNITFDPAVGSADVGNTVELSLLIDSTDNVQGADVRFSFDPAILTAVDANGGNPRTGFLYLPADRRTRTVSQPRPEVPRSVLKRAAITGRRGATYSH
jgi:hypothetical protein